LEFDLYRLRESIQSRNQEERDKFLRATSKSVRILAGIARKVAYHRIDSYRLTGAYYWEIDEQKKAVKWWHRAVQEGERMGARPQLARLYLEVGRCLLEEKGKYTKLDGLEGEAYLEKARALFKEMKTELFLDEIDRVFQMRRP
jgi:hypothetical protein